MLEVRNKYEYMGYFLTNPITQKMNFNHLRIMERITIDLDEFELEGKKPFANMKIRSPDGKAYLIGELG